MNASILSPAFCFRELNLNRSNIKNFEVQNTLKCVYCLLQCCWCSFKLQEYGFTRHRSFLNHFSDLNQILTCNVEVTPLAPNFPSTRFIEIEGIRCWIPDIVCVGCSSPIFKLLYSSYFIRCYHVVSTTNIE